MAVVVAGAWQVVASSCTRSQHSPKTPTQNKQTTDGNPVLALAPTFPPAQNHTLSSLGELPEFDPPVSYGKKGKSFSGSFNATDFINVGAPPPTWAEFVAALTTG